MSAPAALKARAISMASSGVMPPSTQSWAEIRTDIGLPCGHAALAGHDCPCVVCHAADPRLFAALPTGQDIGPAFSLQEPARPWFALRDDPAPSPAPLGLAPDPRGPPTLSA